MSKTKSTLNLSFGLAPSFKKKKVDLSKKKESETLQKGKMAIELTDEIRSFRQKKKEFEATNDHETYVIVTFSTKED